MARKKITPKFNTYALIQHAVEEGCANKIPRTWKYRDDRPPQELIDAICEHAEMGVMNALSEILKYD